MTKTQKAAAEAIKAQFLECVDVWGKTPNETFSHPATGKLERNGVTIDVRQLKLLAGLPVDEVKT